MPFNLDDLRAATEIERFTVNEAKMWETPSGRYVVHGPRHSLFAVYESDQFTDAVADWLDNAR